MNTEKIKTAIRAIEMAIDWNLPLSLEEQKLYKNYCKRINSEEKADEQRDTI